MSSMFKYMKHFEDGDFIRENFGHLSFILTLFAAASCVVIFFKYALSRNYYVSIFPSRKLRYFNVWGNLKDLVSERKVKGVSLNAYILQILMGYSQLFKNKGLFFFAMGYSPFIVVTKAKEVEAIIAASKNMEKAWIYQWLHPWLGTGLLTSHGSKWKSRRKMLTPSFHFEILKDFLPVFNEQSKLLVDLLDKETKYPWTDIIQYLTLCSLDIVCETTLGVSVGAQKNSESEYVQAVLRTSDVIMTRLTYPPYYLEWYFFLSPVGIQFRKDLKLLHGFTRKVISEKKQKLQRSKENQEENGKKKRKALMDVLLEQHIQNEALTEEDIREEVDTFAFEGHDTTSMGLSWALYLIGLHKDVQERIHEDIDRIFGDDNERDITTSDLKELEYLDRVLKEAQRLYPSVPIIGRKLSEEMILCDTKVPKECTPMIFTYGLHRDESVWPNPEKFDPGRFLPENSVNRSPFAYIPFSAGPRNCIGQRFALMEEKVVITNVLRHYIVESLDARDKVLAAPELILRVSAPIRMKLRSRKPKS